MRSKAFRVGASVGLLLIPSVVFGHTVLVDPAPMSPNDDAKQAPCGCVIGDPVIPCDDPYEVSVLQTGTEITVTWNETIDHAGDFRVSFSPKPPTEVTEADFEDAAISVTVPDTIQGGIGSASITLPDAPCESCTIQVRQFMKGSAQPYYYTCAAIRLEQGPVGTGGGSGSGSSGSGSSGSGSSSTGGPTSSSVSGGDDGEPTVAPPTPNDGCSVATDAKPGAGTLLAGLALAVAALRKRRRSPLG
jgi:MYXO-CTERM domain-containing protein